MDLAPQEHRVLSEGCVYMHPASNAAPGTYGGTVHDLCRRGLMQEDMVHRAEARRPGVTHSTLVANMLECNRYIVTRKGRDIFVSYGHPYVPVTSDASPDQSGGE